MVVVLRDLPCHASAWMPACPPALGQAFHSEEAECMGVVPSQRGPCRREYEPTQAPLGHLGAHCWWNVQAVRGREGWAVSPSEQGPLWGKCEQRAGVRRSVTVPSAEQRITSQHLASPAASACPCGIR